MADFGDDADLLLLAGAGGEALSSDSETSDRESEAGDFREQDGQQSRAQQSLSPRDPASPQSPASVNRPSSASRTKKRKGGEDDSEEEGEAESTPASPADSLQSAPMDQSDSENEAPPVKRHDAMTDGEDEEGENIYTVENLYVSVSEKAEVLAMREVDRESWLASRKEEIDRVRRVEKLRQLIDSNQNEGGSLQVERTKRKADSQDPDGHLPKTSRQRKNELMDSRKKNRAEKNDRARRRQEDRTASQTSRMSPDDRDDLDGDEDDDRGDDEFEGHSSSAQRDAGRSHRDRDRDKTPASVNDVYQVQINKPRFVKNCFTRGFEEAAKGCFIRVRVGDDPGTRQPVYRMAVIREIVIGRGYAMADAAGNQFVTEQYALAAHGKAEKEWPFIYVSDGPITEAELNRYKQTCLVEGVKFPSRQEVIDTYTGYREMSDRHLTNDEINDKIVRKKALMHKYMPNPSRPRLERELEVALARGEDERARELQDRLDSMETPRLAHKTSLQPPKTGTGAGIAQQERLAKLNQERRRQNQEAVRKAQLAEKAHQRGLEEAAARGESVNHDRSRRVKTKAKFVHNEHDDSDSATAALRKRKEQESAAAAAAKNEAGKGVDSGTSTPANGTGTPLLGASSKVTPQWAAKLQQQRGTATDSKGLPTIHRPIMDDDVIASLDLGIDADILG